MRGRTRCSIRHCEASYEANFRIDPGVFCVNIEGDSFMKIEFIKPRFVGPRYDEHTLPMDVARDLAAYEELVVELAKHLYLLEHPERQRVPKGFENSFSLHLQQVEAGSTKPILAWVAAGALALQGGAGGYFEQARELVTECVSASSAGQQLPQKFPKHLLDYFNVFGRSLRDGESVELPGPAGAAAAVLTPERRKALVLAAQKVYTKDVELTGTVGETDWEKHTIRLRLEEGTAVNAPLPDAFEELARKAGGKERTLVQIKGIGIFDAWDRLQKLAETHHMELLPNQSLAVRIDALAMLEDGWLDGLGTAPNKEQLAWATDRLVATFPETLPYPHVAPTAEGGLFLEWIQPASRISAEILLPNHKCEVQATNTATRQSVEQEFNLDQADNWPALFEFVRAHV